MRMESEELRNLPLHMQEQVGVALAEQMEQAAPVEEDHEGSKKPMTYGDKIRSMNDEELAGFLAGLMEMYAARVIRTIEQINSEDAEEDTLKLLKKPFAE